MVDNRLQILWDQFEIRQVIEAYVHACDRADRDAVIDVYHEDSYDHHGKLSGPGHQFAAECVKSLLDVWESCNHLLGQSRIKLDGDSAGAETFYFATQTRNDNGEMMMDQQLGRYVDQFERRDGVWRIKDRRCIQEWSMTFPLGDSFVERGTFIPGIRSEEDLSYKALGLKWGCSRITY